MEVPGKSVMEIARKLRVEYKVDLAEQFEFAYQRDIDIPGQLVVDYLF